MYYHPSVPISYHRIVAAKAHYETRGYTYQETPWIIPTKVYHVTDPYNKKITPFVIANNTVALTASGEQSFLALIFDGVIQPGKYHTITPCFRDDDADALHQKYFLKHELIIWDHTPDTLQHQLTEMISEAISYITTLIQHKDHLVVEVVPSDKKGEQDITINGIEIGSYGIRHYETYHWVYGTGLAEPRFSIACGDV